ncbi:ATP-binding cassette sub-family C member 5-like [Palaemon carinicauda]|uniref:ATP-binding cassette sub-family C member 5-like n=1 Tax=Palaemon carinicauda TaxID=392227 RepID=UPI0035B67907
MKSNDVPTNENQRRVSEGNENKDESCCKYAQTLKQCLPVRLPPKNKEVLPTRYAGLFSTVSVNWMTSLMWKAYKKKISEDDLWELPREESAKTNGDRLGRLWEEEIAMAKKAGRPPRLWRAVWRFSRTRTLVAQVIAMISNITFFIGVVVFLQKILEYISSAGIDHIYATYLLLGKLFISSLLQIMCYNAVNIMGIHNGSRLAGALQALVYKKTLTLKTGGENLAAQVINFSTNDMERILEASLSCVFLIEVPFIFLMNLGYCVTAYGPLAAVGFGVYLIFHPTMALIARVQSNIREETIRETDRRVGLMSEILNSIRLIKMYAWEEAFAKKIADIRKNEMDKHRIGALLSSTMNTLTPCIGILATIATLLSFTLTGQAVTSSEAFTIFNLFTLMGFTVSVLPYVMRCLAEAAISLSRMESLLNLPEHKQTSAGKDSAGTAIEIEDAIFAWDEINIDDKKEKLKHVRKRTTSTDEKDTSEEESPSSSNTCKKNRSENSSKSIAGSIEGTMSENRGKHENSSSGLYRITLTVPHGKLVGVCGSIGSGKSSLISAICGDMRINRGNIFVNGKIALVTQQAWIYSGTLRDNLLLGASYDEIKYKETVRVCCLQSDLDMLPAGDLTEIGDRGINLSGGQKQRVNLARAVYSDRDIYLLDDPLSAVDTKVASAIFNNCIKSHLRGKTVMLITHALHLLEQCDEIVVMNGGRVSEQGTHGKLLARRGDYYQMVGGIGVEGGDSCKGPKESTKPEEGAAERQRESSEEEGLGLDGKLTTEETKESGGVSALVYKTFVRVCGGWCLAVSLLAAVIVFVLLRLQNMIWLQIWLDEGDGLKEERLFNVTEYNLTLSEEEVKGSVINNPLLWMYQTVYATSFVALLVVGIAKGVGITFSVLKGATNLHNAMFKSILRSPLTFFDVTPSGRILNRFSRDLDEIDIRVPFFLEFVIQGMLSALGQVLLVCMIYAWFAIPIAVVVVLFFVIDIFLNAGVRELKRIDNMRKSPVIQHIGSSLNGLSVIRTFDQQELFTNRMYHYLDSHTVAQLIFRLSSRWYVFRTDMLSFSINACITALCVYTKGLVSTAAAGLALSTMSAVCDFFPYLMKMKSEFQSRFTAVERLVEYSYELESEASWEDPGKDPPRGWPEFGKVEMNKVCLRYRPNLPLVLHSIEAIIKPGQKIGVVGRTGAGKSSLISTLLRLVELESGSVIIDGVDVSTVGLHTLRSAISVIPQDPVLFQGSIRYNLDPFEEHSDTSVWEALEQSNLKKVVMQQEMGLQSAVATAGENFSVGERQLICLTRALLRRSKILLLDEATASVDLETDQMIQLTIRKAFVDSTVITIAHRLNTITTYDKIMVLQEGRLVEFDSPDNLMRKEGSLFAEMMSAVGVFTVEQMRSLT